MTGPIPGWQHDASFNELSFVPDSDAYVRPVGSPVGSLWAVGYLGLADPRNFRNLNDAAAAAVELSKAMPPGHGRQRGTPQAYAAFWEAYGQRRGVDTSKTTIDLPEEIKLHAEDLGSPSPVLRTVTPVAAATGAGLVLALLLGVLLLLGSLSSRGRST